MQGFSQFWANTVIRYRWWFLLGTLALMAAAPLSFKGLYYDNSNEAYFLEHDPNLVAFDNLIEHFGDPEYLVVGVPKRSGDSDVFSADTIGLIDEITRFLEDHEFVSQVRSLSKYQYTHDDGGMMATDDLFEDIEELAENPSVLDDAREIMASEQLALGTLITADFQHTRIAARVSYRKNENDHNVKLVSDLMKLIEDKGWREAGFELRLSGSPVISERFETLTLGDQAWINPTMAVIILCILFVVFRSIFATFAPLFIILSTMLFVTSLQGLLHWPHTAVTSALIPTMIILSIGTSVHVFVEFFQARRKGLSPKDAARVTTRDLFFAILFTSLTTAVGFIALSVTELRPVRQFSLLAAFGPMVIFLMCTTALPALLSFIPWLPRNQKNLREGEEFNTPISWLSNNIPGFTLRNRKVLTVSGILITLFSLYSVSFIKVDTNIVNYFKSSNWITKDLSYFDEQFKGIANLEFILNSGEEGGVKNPDFLLRAESLQNWLESFDETGNGTSVVDFYKQINQSLNEDREEFFTLPSTRAMAAQFLLLYENTGADEDLSDMKDFNDQYMRMSIPIINMDESQTSSFLDKINAGIAQNYSDIEMEMTGSIVMNNAQNVYVNHGMFRSFGIAIFVIGLSFIVLFRSFKYGVIALVPSIVPILLTGGLTSLAGISLDLGTMIVGAMTIGIAVDDSIHIMSRYLLQRRRGHNAYDAVSHALASSGRAVMLTSVILVTGFSVMLLGSFMPFIYVGLFSAMIMFLALVGDLLFMPAILLLIDGKTDNQHSSTPVAEGLTKDTAEKNGDLANV